MKIFILVMWQIPIKEIRDEEEEEGNTGNGLRISKRICRYLFAESIAMISYK